MNKIVKIIIGSLILLGIVLGAYFCFFKKDSSWKNEENNNSLQTEENDNLDSVSEILLNKINEYHLYHIDENNSYDSSVPTKESLYAMFDYYKEERKVGEYKEYKLSSTITKNQVDTYYKNVYNITLSEYPNYRCWEDGNSLYEYNTNEQAYKFDINKHGHGDYHDAYKAFKLNIEKNSDDSYSITILKMRLTEGGYLLGNDYVENVNDNLDNIVIKNKDYYPQYKYTFTKTDNNYYLLKLEVIK